MCVLCVFCDCDSVCVCVRERESESEREWESLLSRTVELAHKRAMFAHQCICIYMEPIAPPKATTDPFTNVNCGPRLYMYSTDHE